MQCNSCKKNIPENTHICPFCRQAQAQKTPEPTREEISPIASGVPTIDETQKNNITFPLPLTTPVQVDKEIPIVTTPTIIETTPIANALPVESTESTVDTTSLPPVGKSLRLFKPAEPAPLQPVSEQNVVNNTIPISTPETPVVALAEGTPLSPTEPIIPVAPEPQKILTKTELKIQQKEARKLEKEQKKTGTKVSMKAATTDAPSLKDGEVISADAYGINKDAYYDNVEPDVADSLPRSPAVLVAKIISMIACVAIIGLLLVYYL